MMNTYYKNRQWYFLSKPIRNSGSAAVFLPLTEHEQDSLHLSLLGGGVELARVEPQFLPPGESKAVLYQFGLK